MKEVVFYPSSKNAELVVPPPKPAKECLQQWYKNKKIFNDEDPVFEGGVIKNISVKACVPFYDAMTSGYIQETWCDIHIKENLDDSITYNYSGFPKIMAHREKSSIDMGNQFYNTEFVWQQPWVPKTPKGYSVLVTSPLNFMLPFQTISGIIDCDVFYHVVEGSVPFYIKKDFNGIIPAGTPMYQFILIKRDSWKRKIEKWDEDSVTARTGVRARKFIGVYRNNFHIKKKYI